MLSEMSMCIRLRRLAQSLLREVLKVLVWDIFIVNSRIAASSSRRSCGDPGEILRKRSCMSVRCWYESLGGALGRFLYQDLVHCAPAA